VSGPDLRRVESVPGQLVVDTTVGDVLGRAHFERFTASTGLPATWDQLRLGARRFWTGPVAHLIEPVHELLDRVLDARRAGAAWIVGARDTTLAASSTAPELAWCGHGIDQWQCSRDEGHPADVHVAGNGLIITAVSVVAR
jgi:hypothetical protein